MTSSPTLREAERIHKMGAAVHWLHAEQKRPIESGWTSGPRRKWEYLRETYISGLNVGIRLGTPSRIAGGYLAVVDVDVKSTDKRHRIDALRAARKLLGDKFLSAPIVSSGRGNGSRHYYVLTKEPFKTWNPASSADKVKVFMPSKKPSKAELAKLSEKEIADGFRIANAWEISLYSDGRQVVIPPSIHPDSGEPYVWKKLWTTGTTPPLVEFQRPAAAPGEGLSLDSSSKNASSNYQPVNLGSFPVVDLGWLPISDKVRKAIVEGAGVSDRSGYLLTAATALHSAGLTREEILGVLTDPNTFLGACAYDHAKTADRVIAAKWVDRYTVAKILNERDGAAVFSEPLKPGSLTRVAEANDEFKTELEAVDWRSGLQRTQKGKLLESLHNVHLILTKTFGEKLFRFNDFAKIDEVWEKTPWGGAIGEEFKERDIHRMRLWFSHQWGFEPTEDKVWAAVVIIADNNVYHPVKEYLLALPPHDGVRRVDFFLEKYLNGEAPQKYLHAISRKTLVAMVARIFEPGRKFDTMLVIEGAQGLKKSTAVMVLTGKKWFSDVNLNLKHKDSISDISGKWVIEQGEMNVMSKHDVKELKQFLSRDTDRMRPSYGRKSQDYPRQMIFIGTTNEDIYLKDTTGSRRFWPFKITKDCNIGAISKDRDQIFAEALAMYQAGEPLWIDDKETEHLAGAERAGREVTDELVTALEDWIDEKVKEDPFGVEFNPDKLPMLPLFEIDGPFQGQAFRNLHGDQNGQKRVAEALRKLGFERRVLRIKGKLKKIWVKLPVQRDDVTRRGNEKHE